MFGNSGTFTLLVNTPEGKAFPLEVPPTLTVGELKEKIATTRDDPLETFQLYTKVPEDVQQIELLSPSIFNGSSYLDLDEPQLLWNFSVRLCDIPLGSLDAVTVRLENHAGCRTIEERDENENETETDKHLVADSLESQEMQCTIIVTNVPIDLEDPDATLTELFQVYGPVTRLILQHADPELNAVLIFNSSHAATNALALDGAMCQGQPLSVMSAALLPPLTKDDASESEPTTPLTKLAAAAARFDQEHQLSSKVKVTAEVAKFKASQLNSQFQLSEKVRDVRSSFGSATTTASALTTQAMEQPQVKSARKKLGSLFTNLKSTGSTSFSHFRHSVSLSPCPPGGPPGGPPGASNRAVSANCKTRASTKH